MVILFLLFIIAIFVLLGVMLSLGKWSFLISGYNMMSKEEKAKYDEKVLCSFMGKVMFSIAFCILLATLGESLHVAILRDIALCAIFVICIFTVIYLNVGKKFKK